MPLTLLSPPLSTPLRCCPAEAPPRSSVPGARSVPRVGRTTAHPRAKGAGGGFAGAPEHLQQRSLFSASVCGALLLRTQGRCSVYLSSLSRLTSRFALTTQMAAIFLHPSWCDVPLALRPLLRHAPPLPETLLMSEGNRMTSNTTRRHQSDVALIAFSSPFPRAGSSTALNPARRIPPPSSTPLRAPTPPAMAARAAPTATACQSSRGPRRRRTAPSGERRRG